jgi:hypothetical protein
VKLAVVIPSRGTIYSQTVDEIYRELNASGVSYQVFWAHCLPIPDCFAVPTEQALATDCTHVLYVEDDMVLPVGIVGRMLKRVKHAIACDYPMGDYKSGTTLYDSEGTALFTGTGLMLVDAELLRALPGPIWRTDIAWQPRIANGHLRFSLSTDTTRHWGHQDTAFGLRLYANGLPIEIMDETIGQRRMVKEGEHNSNSGFHRIVEKLEMTKRDSLTHLPDSGSWLEVVMDGKPVKVTPEQYARLPDNIKPETITVGQAVFEVPDDLRPWLTFHYSADEQKVLLSKVTDGQPE